MKITPYLLFNGQAEEAAAFYADLTGGKIENLTRYSEFPPMEGMPPIPADYGQKIGHCCIIFSGGSLSVADTLPDDRREFGNGHMLTLSCSSVEQAEAAWEKLTPGAKSINCEMGEAFFAKRYGEVVDKYGIFWAVMYEE